MSITGFSFPTAIRFGPGARKGVRGTVAPAAARVPTSEAAA